MLPEAPKSVKKPTEWAARPLAAFRGNGIMPASSFMSPARPHPSVDQENALAAGLEKFDLTVIGSGPGGYVAAIRAAQLGFRTALVEKEKALGGTCLHLGCIPTKALLEAAHVLEMARRADEFGIRTSEVTFDWRAVQDRKQKVVEDQAKGLAFLMKKNKITVFTGTGALAGPGMVRVTSADGTVTELSAGRIILATGSRPRGLPHLRRLPPFRGGFPRPKMAADGA